MSAIAKFCTLWTSQSEPPEIELLRALIKGAIQDYFELNVAGKNKRTRINAEIWLFRSKYHGPWSFAWVCEHLGVSPGRARAAIRQLRRSDASVIFRMRA